MKNFDQVQKMLVNFTKGLNDGSLEIYRKPTIFGMQLPETTVLYFAVENKNGDILTLSKTVDDGKIIHVRLYTDNVKAPRKCATIMLTGNTFFEVRRFLLNF